MKIKYKEIELIVSGKKVFDEYHIHNVFVRDVDIYTLLTQEQLEEIETLILNEL